MESLHIEKNGPVTTVLLDRPAACNAVDRATATALAAAVCGLARNVRAPLP